MNTPVHQSTRPTGWTGWILFAAIVMVLVGLFTVVYGLVALLHGDYYTATPGGLLVFDLTGWGWTHLVIGTVAAAAGIALLTGAVWARVVAVLLAGVNALSQIAFLPASPAWSMIAIALDVLVIWAVVVHGRELA
ncbi:DUF7144 family membrane protein [Actinokineospora cianjurensis]|uniref:DUF7144 domain-containing protein n=1 Tax=Actinokineospora cianjurensis TaxID=585224 RepID=A0A421B1Z3_9PSEU|nr:hypothetical protein [Actinokineospora cianjurensis]RLK58291.1 hypothetical protein CLV68_4388 [Actinokineospora cianjurensis]